MKNNYVCSTYFKKKTNIQSGRKFNADDFIYMKNWYESARKFNLNCIVFHDSLSNDFINKHQDDIQFINVEQKSLNIVDYRWVVYDEYLKINKDNIDMILFTDISDVVFLKNPFDFMLCKPDMLFVGTEETTISNNWITKRNRYFHKIIPDIIEYEKQHRNKKLNNCGILGGNVNLISEFIHDMATILLQANLESTTFDMVVLNYLLYTKYVDKFFAGHPLNTKFKKNEKNNNECYIKHK
jgi:hypothetical protein